MYTARRIVAQPAIIRDGTNFEADGYIDGKWVRFYKNLPRSMGGYKLIDAGNTEIVRNLFEIPQQNINGETTVDIYFGRPSTLQYINFAIEPAGLDGATVDRTPGGFVASPYNVWNFDLLTADDGSDNLTTFLIAHAAPNGNNLNSNVEGQVYYGRIDNNQILQDLHVIESDANVKCSGGILVIGPFLTVYGNDGIIRWSDAGTLNQFYDSNILPINGGKVIYGARTKGGGTPSALFWTISSLVKVSYDPNLDTFASDTYSDSVSILSASSVIEYDNSFYWPGVDQFYKFNGVAQQLPNIDNSEFFYKNLNLQQREKVFGFKLPRYKELWWLFPKGNSIECNHAVIYNLESGRWYDTPLDRTCALSPQFFPYPLMCGSQTEGDRTKKPINGKLIQAYPLWMHEYGVDKILYNRTLAIESYIETNPWAFVDDNPENSKQIRIRRIVPDFKQTGTMFMQINGKGYPNSENFPSEVYNFTDQTEKIDTNFQSTLVSFKFGNNQAGSSFQMGKTFAYYEEGDLRPGG
jgi:hypothetical protein